ncbi:putative ABC transport system ATP-binding protein [Enterococcus rotai]|uniref:Macrolide ABC transporter ATP-binding protein n=1 Tax=Enterococcus rotai TaxID=118060 RepID=A0A0U2IU30_9ENTE|nr:ABC transporter ATP-binding protein [Enterococcus rotai]ALS36654.1 macrolide ABC transporter ATP-binding protein [Enterococcus rotai]
MLEFKNISKEYEVGDQKVKALDDVSFTIEKGKFTVILGPSGSGKSTMLNLLGGMDRASRGGFCFDGRDITKLNDFELSVYRRDVVGFVFQFYNLIPSLTAYENIAIAAQLTGNQDKAENYLKRVGLEHRKNNFPTQMSGGEMQRVSIARALAKSPELLLCDEPTGALDSGTGIKIMEILREAANDSNTAVVMVTHNAEFASIAHKVIRLHDGNVASIEENPHPIDVQEVQL